MENRTSGIQFEQNSYMAYPETSISGLTQWYGISNSETAESEGTQEIYRDWIPAQPPFLERDVALWMHGTSEPASIEQEKMVKLFPYQAIEGPSAYFAESFVKVYGEPVFPSKRRQFGSAKGLIVMSDDFDEPLTDFNDYML